MSDPITRKINGWVDSGVLSGAAGDALVQWLSGADFEAFRAEIRALIHAGDTDELEDAFGSDIAFGTGGIRGRMGFGPNRFNTRTVGVAAQGLAQYIARAVRTGGTSSRDDSAPTGNGNGDRAVVVAWDTRHNSESFANETARVLAANGISVKIFDGCRSTPALSFAVRDLRAAAGVMISASHNPPVYNGFKVYGSDGGQVVAPRDEDITREMRSVTEIRRVEYEDAARRGLIRTIGKDLDDRYIGILSEMTLADARDVQLVYTPLHGVGMASVAAALERLGYRDVRYVDEQVRADGAFPTLDQGIANPEKPAAFRLGIRKAAETGADLVLASDPDADRIGCALPLPDRGWTAPPEDLVLNGHQIGALLCHYLLSRKRSAGTLPARGLFCKTLVTSDLAAIIARSYGLEVKDDLPVGFKHVGAAIESMSPDMTFVFGTEESHGYLADARIRDKEAATGILLAEYAALVKMDNRTLRDELDDIYRMYGYFREVQQSVALPGTEGARTIADIMAFLRATPPKRIGGYDVCRMIDRQNGQALDLLAGTTTRVGGDRVNILVFTFSDSGNTRVIVRPSGTEPTIKYYVSASTRDLHGRASDVVERDRPAVDRMAEGILDAMIDLCGKM